jgi:hypothetical protein
MRAVTNQLPVNKSIHTRFFALGINFYISQYAQFFRFFENIYYRRKQFTDLLGPL